jgi:seryl-tRNA synthetase
MLELHVLRTQTELVLAGLEKKRFKQPELVDQILQIDEDRRATQKATDDLLNRQNLLSKEIGGLIKAGDKEGAEAKKAQIADLKEESKLLEEKLVSLEQQQSDLLVQLPNLPHTSVPQGVVAEDNEVVKQHGNIPVLPAGSMPHWDLGKKYGLFDLELGVKLTGAGFPVYRGKGAKLQRALISFFLDRATAAGYFEVIPPHMVNAASAFGTGQLPDKESQMYHAPLDEFYLIPTAEVPVTNIHRDEILEEEQLPLKYVAYTPCFRREAGSYGKDVRGLNRVHQFDKVEIVQISHPEKSYEILEDMKRHVEGLLQELELPYRILRLCGGDMSFGSALTFDFEVYSTAQQRWLEVSSVSNFETFQSNRMKLRYRDAQRKIRLAHTLNGSALALPRIVAGLLENHQDESGIRIPACLQPYTGFDRI